MDFNHIPNFCAHEHWGSIDAIGPGEGVGFRADAVQGALPARRVNLLDLICDPYFGGHMASTGATFYEQVRERGFANPGAMADKESVGAAWALVAPALAGQELTGTYQCLRRGIECLYGVDILNAGEGALERLSEAIGDRYDKIFAWYREAMAKAHFGGLIRPVHFEFFWNEQTPESAAEERAFTHPIMRIDDLAVLADPQNARRAWLVERLGIEPVDAKSTRELIERLFDKAAEQGNVGIKQLQAYFRNLDFQPRADGDVTFGGKLDGAQMVVFMDWVVNECCRQAHERGWPHQIHVGTHNLPNSTPLPLQGLAQRYPKMNIVMLHCWPFLNEAGHLAKYVKNIHIDSCWQPVLNPGFLRQSLATWLGYVPTNKIMLSHDSTSVEMAVGSSLYTRELLAEGLAEAARESGMDAQALRRVATDMLNNNAVRVYGVGRTV